MSISCPINKGLFRSIVRGGLVRSCGESLCNLYEFTSTNSDSLSFDTAFTGNFKMIVAGTSSTGIPAELLAGLRDTWVDTVDYQDPQWNYIDVDVVDLVDIAEDTFDGVICKIYKDDVEFSIDMGAPSVYALRFSAYSGATLTEQVTITDEETISFSLVGLDASDAGSSHYLLGSGVTGSYIYYRGSSNRLRMASDDGTLYTFSVSPDIIMDGGQHTISVRFSNNQGDLWVDGVYVQSVSGIFGDFSVDYIASSLSISGAIYDVNISSVASYPMLTYSTAEVNGQDYIGDNTLAYSGTGSLAEDDFVEVK